MLENSCLSLSLLISGGHSTGYIKLRCLLITLFAGRRTPANFSVDQFFFQVAIFPLGKSSLMAMSLMMSYAGPPALLGLALHISHVAQFDFLHVMIFCAILVY